MDLSPRDDLSMRSGLEYVDFKTGGVDTSYTTIPVTIGYDRKFSARTTLGVSVSAQRTDYKGPGHFRGLSPEVTAHVQLSEQLSFSGAVGASFASIDDGVSTRHTTGLTANANLCSATEHGSFCGHASIDQAAATIAGPAKTERRGRLFEAPRRQSVDLLICRFNTLFDAAVGAAWTHFSQVRPIIGSQAPIRGSSARGFSEGSIWPPVK